MRAGTISRKKTAEYLPGWFNCSNDDIEIDSRSAKKGPEAESVTVGQIGGQNLRLYRPGADRRRYGL